MKARRFRLVTAEATESSRAFEETAPWQMRWAFAHDEGCHKRSVRCRVLAHECLQHRRELVNRVGRLQFQLAR